MRLSLEAFKLLNLLSKDREKYLYGAEIAQSTGVKNGTLYPLLIRLEKSGCLSSFWEDVDPVFVGRKQRHFYKITELGYQEFLTVNRQLLNKTCV